MSSVEGLQIESHYFKDTDYVLIRVDIGKMPPHAAKAYITRLRSETALCKELDDRGIRYDLVGVRDNGVSGMEIRQEEETPCTGEAEPPEKVTGDNSIAIGRAAGSLYGDTKIAMGSNAAVGNGPINLGPAKVKIREPNGSKVETLPMMEETPEESLVNARVRDELVKISNTMLKNMASVNQQVIKDNKSKTVVASRNEILKANDLSEDLKHDSFADAMRLLDDQ